MFSPNGRYCAYFANESCEVWESRAKELAWSTEAKKPLDRVIIAVTNDGCVVFRSGEKYQGNKLLGRYGESTMIQGSISPCGKYLGVWNLWLFVYDVDTFELLARQETPISFLTGFLDSDTFIFSCASKTYSWKWRELIVCEDFDRTSLKYLVRQARCGTGLDVFERRTNKPLFWARYSGMWLYKIVSDHLVVADENAITVYYLNPDGPEVSKRTSSEGPLIIMRHTIPSIPLKISNDGSLVLYDDHTICDLLEDSFTLLFSLQLVLPLPLYVILLIHDWYAFLSNQPSSIEAIDGWQHGKKVRYLQSVQRGMRRVKEKRVYLAAAVFSHFRHIQSFVFLSLNPFGTLYTLASSFHQLFFVFAQFVLFSLFLFSKVVLTLFL